MRTWSVDECLMFQALLEARRALPDCLPQAPVGCVIAAGGRIVARGRARPLTRPETEALSRLHPADAQRDLDVYLTLEPRADDPRLEASMRALLGLGVRRLLIGAVDPDPRGRGAGLARLRGFGLRVEAGVLQETIGSELAPYLFPNRPASAPRLGYIAD